MTGNLLGALWGEAAIPVAWLDALELRAEIAVLADRLAAAALRELDAETASIALR
jgi:hypothetical protein